MSKPPQPTPQGFMPAAASRVGLLLAAGLAVTPLPASAVDDDPGYVWMSRFGDGNALLTYGSAETGEDYVFNLICRNKDKSTGAISQEPRSASR